MLFMDLFKQHILYGEIYTDLFLHSHMFWPLPVDKLAFPLDADTVTCRVVKMESLQQL